MIETLDVDKGRVKAAFQSLGLMTKSRYGAFRRTVDIRAREIGLRGCDLLAGLSHETIKRKPANGKWPNTLPHPLVDILFRETGIDVTPKQSLAAFNDLDFEIRLELPVTTANNAPGEPKAHSIDGMLFEIAEANTELDDGDELIDIRIGFDRVRLTIRADTGTVTSNDHACETAAEPGEGSEPDYTGWFRVKFQGSDPLNWLLSPLEDGQILSGRVDVHRTMARIETGDDVSVIAELSVRREAAKVRIVSENPTASPRDVTEDQRTRMFETIAKRSIGRGTPEFLIHRQAVT